jgi:hypothetical protein
VSRGLYIDPFDIFHVAHTAFWRYADSGLGLGAALLIGSFIPLLTHYWSQRGDIATAPDGHGIIFAIARLILRLLPFAILSFLVFITVWTGIRSSVIYNFYPRPLRLGVPPSITARILPYGLAFNGVLCIFVVFAVIARKAEQQTVEGLLIFVCLLASLLAVSANADWWLSQSHAIFVVEQPTLGLRGGVSAAVRRLSKIDASYFAVTTLTTLGLGDIRPTGDEGRLIVILQSLGNFAVIGLGLSLLFDKLHQAQPGR